MTISALRAEQAEEGKYAGALRKMTPEVLRDVCAERHMWNQPHLNTQLFLNYKGFDAIAGLENYVAVRSLHLGNNNIAKIEGLDRMSDLRSLHLEGNRIRFIENLEGNAELRQLNLENNGIQSVGCLDYLVKLEQLNLAKNNLEKMDSLEGLKSLPQLANVDVSHNRIESTEEVVDFWSSMAAKVKVLRYQGNPGIRHIEHYRKRLVNALPSLTYLDERPVLPVERRSCAAWAEGGLQAMHKAKRDFHQERNRAECTVDPERRELLTRMRKAALARIEREERERAEEGERRRSGEAPSAGSGPAVSSGAAGEKSQHADTEEAQNSDAKEATEAEAVRAGFGFAPPARGGPQRRGLVQPQGASSFISCGSGDRTDAAEQLMTRQFAVLGDDPWAGTAAPDPALRRSVESEFGLQQGGGERPGKMQEEVIPQIWEQMREANKEAELKALEQNLSHSKSFSAATPAAECSVSEELAALD
mmetsp:Transcript_2837/g.8746  ORF Transcript_2837/g.8746 Transcript_2837/m.8746 type:complete len:476 (-) Transcript_2837:41-1468(-)